MAEPDKSATKEVLNATVELVKATYGDTLQPAAKEVGKALGIVGKTVNIALLPLEAFVWSFETIKQYVTEAVSRQLEERQVPLSRIQTPDPDIAVPALEALRYSKLRENFAILLATSWTTKRQMRRIPLLLKSLNNLPQMRDKS